MSVTCPECWGDMQIVERVLPDAIIPTYVPSHKETAGAPAEPAKLAGSYVTSLRMFYCAKDHSSRAT